MAFLTFLAGAALSIAGIFLAWPMVSWVVLRLWRRGTPPLSQGRESPLRLAVLICAHNEERVLEELLAALAAQTRKPDRVYVTADGCTDGTVAVARRFGATVWERPVASGKGAALRESLQRLADEPCDAVCFFDADTMPSPDFLRHIADALADADVVCGVRGMKEGDSSPVAMANALAIRAMMILYFKPRFRLKIPAMIQGTGYAVRRAFWQALRWEPKTQTEDLAFTIESAMAGARFQFAPHAEYGDEQPDRWNPTFQRMRRWMAGGVECLRLYGGDLRRAGLRRRAGLLDLWAYLTLVPALAVKAAAALVLCAVALAGNPWPIVSLAAGDAVFAVVAACFGAMGLRARPRDLAACALFMLTLPWVALSVYVRPTTRWQPIQHRGTGRLA